MDGSGGARGGDGSPERPRVQSLDPLTPTDGTGAASDQADGATPSPRAGRSRAHLLAVGLVAVAIIALAAGGSALLGSGDPGPAPPSGDSARLAFGPEDARASPPEKAGRGDASTPPAPRTVAGLPRPGPLPVGVERDPTAEDQLSVTAPEGGVLYVLRAPGGQSVASSEAVPVYLAVARSEAAQAFPPLAPPAEAVRVGDVTGELRRGDGRRARELRWSDGPFSYRLWTSASAAAGPPDALLRTLAEGVVAPGS